MKRTMKQIIENPFATEFYGEPGASNTSYSFFASWVYKYSKNVGWDFNRSYTIAKEDEKYFSPLFQLFYAKKK